MRKIILRNNLSPGDIVMLTAAVRELHLAYPRAFQTDVRTRCGELWDNNPYLTRLSDSAPGVELIDCSYPLINRCDEAPYHCLHGFIEFLNLRLGLAIKPRRFKGDIHLSSLEKHWYSQVHEIAGSDLPFWIIAAGGKYDISIKWWNHERYQAVVDHFRGKILFVQVGQAGHYHPKLTGALDLRGQTSLRELVRLVYHAQGVLCPVTALMHLSAAVESKCQEVVNRPCVVIAGAREPVHWEAYPGHQFISTNGCVPCSGAGGCWKARIRPLGDGDHRDSPENLCENVVGNLPRCMDLITAKEVIRRIELYYDGGVLEYLAPGQVRVAKRAVSKSSSNPFDSLPLTLGNARIALGEFISTMAGDEGNYAGRGIVICGGGFKYFTNAWVCIKMLRHFGCELPIELWHIGSDEIDSQMVNLVKSLGVQCRDAKKEIEVHPVRRLGGWELKPYAILYSRFQEVLFLDADNVPVKNPDFLFSSKEYLAHGAIFWPDYGQFKKAAPIWTSCGIPRPDEPEFESGQILVDKKRCWKALRLALWFNEHSDFYYQRLHGDKETFHLAFRKLNQRYFLIPTPIQTLPRSTMCQHDALGRRLFQHRNSDKWTFHFPNKRVPDFHFEAECRMKLQELQMSWDGGMSRYVTTRGRATLTRQKADLRFHVCMISCAKRTALRKETLSDLAKSDWGNRPIHIEMDRQKNDDPQIRQTKTAWLALRHSLDTPFDYLLFLEDDLVFNRHILSNLTTWSCLRSHRPSLAGLYNPGLPAFAGDMRDQACLVRPENVYGSQAFLISRRAVNYLVARWKDVHGMQDIKISRLAPHREKLVWYHSPSLVQHVGKKSVWGGTFHYAKDFRMNWRNPELANL